MSKKEILYRDMSLNFRSQNVDKREITLSFSSETPYKRFFGPEILCHDEGAVDLGRLQDIGVLLFNHDSSQVLGKVINANLDEKTHRCIATVEFDTDALSEEIYQKVLSGTLKGVSVGYVVDVWEEVATGVKSSNGRFSGPCNVATKWTPYEISIASVPADASVGIGRSMEKGGEEMSKNELDGIINKAIENERFRVAEISKMCRNFSMPSEEIDGYVKSGKTVDEVRKIILEKKMSENTPSNIIVGNDEGTKFRHAAVDGLSLRAGLQVKSPTEGAQDFRHISLMDLAKECCLREGQNVNHYGREDIIRRALTGAGAFPDILSSVANKSMAQAYISAPTTFQLWTSKGSNTDFKKSSRYRLSETDDLQLIPESGEFKSSTVAESAITTDVQTYGRAFSLSRKAIINDDLGALKQIPARYGASARRLINHLVYKSLEDNKVIDKVALFHKTHANLGEGTLSIESLGKAKAAMAKQTNIKGKEKLNIQPAFLIVPVELEVLATQLVSSTVDPTKQNATPNPFANKLTVVADPELTDSKAWYLAAAPGLYPSVEVTYLNGVEKPKIESQILFDSLGIQWRIYMDFGVNILDFRGLYKSTGM